MNKKRKGLNDGKPVVLVYFQDGGEQKGLCQKAAKRQGKSLSQFFRDAAVAHAQKILDRIPPLELPR